MTFSLGQKLALFIAAFTVVACVNSMWAEDLTNAQNEYCANVHAKIWPDYKKTFEKSCIEWLTKQDN